MAVTKKKTAKKKTAKKKACTTVKSKVHHPTSVDDYFCKESGELLHPQHEMFCHAWVQTFDNEKACREAGFKVRDGDRRDRLKSAHDQARQLLRRPEIQKRVRAILSERAQDMAVTQDWVVLKLLEVIEKGMAEKPVYDREGAIIGYEHSDLRTALGALVKLGENVGMFTKKEEKSAQQVVFNLNYGGEQPQQLTRQPLQGESERLN